MRITPLNSVPGAVLRSEGWLVFDWDSWFDSSRNLISLNNKANINDSAYKINTRRCFSTWNLKNHKEEKCSISYIQRTKQEYRFALNLHFCRLTPKVSIALFSLAKEKKKSLCGFGVGFALASVNKLCCKHRFMIHFHNRQQHFYDFQMKSLCYVSVLG